jgi:Asp-tRNA(Asn)/Glu-tRNA(Gln) amidotransferase A subunit family amidase
VPLFVEEVTRLLLELGEQGGIRAVLPTLQQSLSARLDRLGPAREVAQIGAVIGRDFSYSLLQRAVAGMDDAPLQVARLTEVMTRYDSILSATLPAPPPELGYFDMNGDVEVFTKRVTEYLSITPLHNAVGTPAVTVPLHA